MKTLGYTHTEAGFREIGQLSDEISEYEDMLAEAKDTKNDTYM